MPKRLSLAALALLSACAHQATEVEEIESKATPVSTEAVMPLTQASYQGNRGSGSGSEGLAVGGPLSVIAVSFQLAQNLDKARSPTVQGSCKVLLPHTLVSGLSEEPCRDTYVVFENLKDKHKAKVWIDTQGHFEFALRKGETYEITAYSDKDSLTSKSIRTSRPGRLRLTIDRR